MSINFSVLISVYKKEKTLFFNQAFNSIWTLQSLKPSEIVLVQDGPLSIELLNAIDNWKSIIGDRLKIVEISNNVGLGPALNYGLQHCKYDLVIRMDTDDIAHSERFHLQTNFMYENPNVSVSSGYIEEWDYDFQNKLHSRALPNRHQDILHFAKSRSPISHAACIYRKRDIMSVGGYPDSYPEDYTLWINLLRNGKIMANIDDLLLYVRTGDEFYRRRGYQFFLGELKVLSLQRKYKMISDIEYIKYALYRFCLRTSPAIIKKTAYRIFR